MTPNPTITIRDKLKFAANQLDDRTYFHTNRLSDEYGDLTLSPESDSILHHSDSPPLPESEITFTLKRERKGNTQLLILRGG